MNLYYGILWLLGLSFWLTPLHSQGKLEDLQQIQLLIQDECVIVQVNADWNIKAIGSSVLTGSVLLKLSADFDFQNLFSKSDEEALIFLNNLYLSKINAQEYIELAIRIIITDLTTKSALKKSCHSEKSFAPPKPTTCDAISCSILDHYF